MIARRELARRPDGDSDRPRPAAERRARKGAVRMVVAFAAVAMLAVVVAILLFRHPAAMVGLNAVAAIYMSLLMTRQFLDEQKRRDRAAHPFVPRPRDERDR